MSLLFYCPCHYFYSLLSVCHSIVYSRLGFLMLVVFVIESPRSVACGICAEGSIGVMSYTTLGAKVVRLWLASNVNALLVFLVTDLPLATRMVSRASNVACKLSCSVGAEMLSSTKTRRRICLLLPYRKQLEYKCCSIAIAPLSRV
jgi:hypothetical protein